MNHLTRHFAALLLVSPSLLGCGSAALVRADNAGGRVALRGAYMESVADARLLMSEHCEGRFSVLAADGASMLDAPEPDQRDADFVCARPLPDAYDVVLARVPTAPRRYSGVAASLASPAVESASASPFAATSPADGAR